MTTLHLDIKPLNIIVTPQWTVWLIDFGIERSRYEEGWRGEIMGTPLYTSPEQWGSHAGSEWSDLFRVGAVLQTLFAEFDENPVVAVHVEASDKARPRGAVCLGCRATRSTHDSPQQACSRV